MKRSVFQINKDNIEGTGFFCKYLIPENHKAIHLLITNNHVLDENYIKSHDSIKFKSGNDQMTYTIENLKSRAIITDCKLDVIFIEIKEDEGRKMNKKYLKIEKETINLKEMDFNEIYGQQPLYILNYPDTKDIFVSHGRLNNINNYIIRLTCSSKNRSSGSPILLLDSRKLICIHRGNPSNNFNFTEGTFFKNAKKNFLLNIIIFLMIL